MKRLLYITISLLYVMSAGLAHAQGGWIQLAADVGGASCAFTNATGSFNLAYQIHQASPGTTLSRYMVAPSNPAAFVWLFDNYVPWTAIGSAPAGVAVAYGACKVSPVVIGFSGYTMFAAGRCESLEVVPDPASTSGTIESIDCTLPTPIKYIAGSSLLHHNPGGAYICIPLCGHEPPVENTSWGKIKTLYN